jgi:hypothetical protein
MISVNIDKLINMSLDDKKTYGELAKNVLDELNGEKTFAVVTGGMGSFKLAYSLYEMKKKVLFLLEVLKKVVKLRLLILN